MGERKCTKHMHTPKARTPAHPRGVQAPGIKKQIPGEKGVPVVNAFLPHVIGCNMNH